MNADSSLESWWLSQVLDCCNKTHRPLDHDSLRLRGPGVHPKTLILTFVIFLVAFMGCPLQYACFTSSSCLRLEPCIAQAG